jgi:hypothetical protein
MVMTLYGVCIGAYGALLPVVTDVPYLETGERIVALTATGEWSLGRDPSEKSKAYSINSL